MIVFSKNRLIWKHMEKDIKEYLAENWDRFHNEKPLWFNENLIAKIPRILIPGGDDAAFFREHGEE